MSMNFVIHILLIAHLLFNGKTGQQKNDFDIVVYGGTSAGVIAAVQAAGMGKSVLLISPTDHLGGMTSSGLGWTDLGNLNTIGGLSREFYKALFRYYENSKAWKQETKDEFVARVQKGNQWDRVMLPRNGIMPVFEPHVAEYIFEEMLRHSHVQVVTGKWLNRADGVLKSGTEIVAIRMLGGEQYFGKVFIDATYEGDLMAAAGVSYTIGREANSQYQEDFNGIRTRDARQNQLPEGIDPFIISGDTTSGLLPGVNPDAGGDDGSADKKIQAFCYRMCLTNDPGNRVRVTRPGNYKEADFEILLRAAETGWTKYFKLDKMPNRKTDSNNSGGISTDYIGMNYSYPEASYELRKSIEQAHLYWQSGFLWTLQNHNRIPDSIRSLYQDWGLCKDEFADNNYWPYQIYVREARRMVSDVVITEHHCMNRKKSIQPVALGSYPMDSHNTQRHLVKMVGGGYAIRNEGDVQNQVLKPYGIDYGSIVPRKSEASNLIVPVCLSGTHIAYGSIRMEPVFMMLGQSAATAAAIAVDEGCSVQAVNYDLLKRKLVQDGMVLGLQ